MVITYQEKNYFKIQSGENTILIDPTNQRSLKGADVVIFTTLLDRDVAFNSGTDKKPIMINHQGEYEVNKIHIRGWSTEHADGVEKTMYKIKLDDILIGVLGPITKEVDSKILFMLKDMDILIAPAGGKPNIIQSSVAKLIRQLEPKIVIPSLFKKLEIFIKELGGENIKKEEKLSIKKKDIVQGITKIIVLKQNLSG